MPEFRTAEDARAHFPRGLVQPEGGFRFSADALLLACFAGPGAARRIADLGAGCGVVGFGLLLRDEAATATVTAVDINPDMLAAQRDNVKLLGFGERFEAVEADVSAIGASGLAAQSFDLVVCNPPYRETGTGRRPADAGRDAARFEVRAQVGDFVAAAARLVRNRGRVCFIGLPERLPELFADFRAARLAPKRLRMVHSRIGEPARLALVEGMLGASAGLIVEPPLVLYEGTGNESCLCADALAFCPFMACNAGRRG
ncbi:tRNA1Val (adenine37-N6)-methyltransferase [Desulfobaculum xiamenense]|uniref:tRNA1Val (Adenine37-N6)-methyltransferase n=1 Tax=Desulfobaculum xiamenense TaxID=995050 RepID=A0A846QKI0_9BACT|nr:methyltransferase [Desulfobaculum xiamenense]NJB68641.1 tRNA1Val (adenine37-N6)-methyltransferase [Desulfobaculum xiamenense]